MVEAPRMRQADMSSDDQWLSDFLNDRDEAAFERLVVRYGPMVLRVCRDVLADHSAADDAFQATFLVLFRQAGSIRDRDSVGRWLYEVACRVARRARNAESKRRAQERRALTMEAATSPDHEVSDREWRPILHEEIGRLPSKFRDALVLCYLEGLTVEAAALKLGCPSGTLKSRLGKGRDLLRARLTRRGLAASVVLLSLFSIEDASQAADVPAPLIRATVGRAFGDPTAVPLRVSALALGEDATRRIPVSRLWVVVALLLAAFWGVRWSLAAWNPRAVSPPAASSFVSSVTHEIARWNPLGSGQDAEGTDHCKKPR